MICDYCGKDISQLVYKAGERVFVNTLTQPCQIAAVCRECIELYSEGIQECPLGCHFTGCHP